LVASFLVPALLLRLLGWNMLFIMPVTSDSTFTMPPAMLLVREVVEPPVP
jgi:hypothetical protein